MLKYEENEAGKINIIISVLGSYKWIWSEAGTTDGSKRATD